MKFNILADVGTTEVPVNAVPGGGNAPTAGRTRVVYSLTINNRAGSTNTVTLRVYQVGGTAPTYEIPITVGAYDTITIEVSSGLLFIHSGYELRAIASAGNATIVGTAEDR